MSRNLTLPCLIDGVKKLSITKLREWGYLDRNYIKSGLITWSCNGVKTDSVNIKNVYDKCIELEYTFNQTQLIEQKITIVKKPSNLGKGELCFFECTQTHKLCRNLYFCNGLFLHREAAKGYLYESQTFSKKYRDIIKHLGNNDSLYECLYKKHSKKHYRDKPTKRYLKLIRKIELSERAELIAYSCF
jgi:hypothetical protein